MIRCKHEQLFYYEASDMYKCADCGMEFELKEVREEW